MVISISSRIFSRRGSLLLKQEAPLRTSIFLLDWVLLSRSCLASMTSALTLAESKVMTLDCTRMQSLASRFRTMLCMTNLTHIEFLSDEYSMWYSRGALLLAGDVSANSKLAKRASSLASLSMKLASLMGSMTSFQRAFMPDSDSDIVLPLSWAASWEKNLLILFYMASSRLFRDLDLNSRADLRLLYSVTLAMSQSLNSRNHVMLDFMKLTIEQFLIFSSRQCSRNRLVSSNSKKYTRSFSSPSILPNTWLRKVYWLTKFQMEAANSLSAWVWAWVVALQASQKVLSRQAQRESTISEWFLKSLASANRQQITIVNLFCSLFSYILTSFGSMLGCRPWYLHEQTKQADWIKSWMKLSQLSLCSLKSKLESRLACWWVSGQMRLRTRVRSQQLDSTAWKDLRSWMVGSSCSMSMFYNINSRAAL